MYRGGEELFALPLTDYPDLGKTEKEVKLADQLFSLYVDVLSTFNDWKGILWSDVTKNIGDMNEKLDGFSVRCKKLPSRLREYSAFALLRTQIEDFQTLLPLIQELTKDSIRDRHWDEIKKITNGDFDQTGPEFRLQSLIDINMPAKKDEIEEITEGADKQLKIEKGLDEIFARWSTAAFLFKEWRGNITDFYTLY
jgi:dynein heavy chain